MVLSCKVIFHGCHLRSRFETQALVHLCVSVDVEVLANGLAINFHMSNAMASAEGGLTAVGIDATAAAIS